MNRHTGWLPKLWLTLILSLLSTAASSNEPLNHYRDYFRQAAMPLESEADLAPLLDAIGERRFVLLGEASHGTVEFYQWRDRISRLLIKEAGFSFIAVEGDWEAIYQLNNYVKHRHSSPTSASEIMKTFDRWPQWLWANESFAEFIEWLHEHNAPLTEEQRIGIFGLDMQDPDASMRAVMAWFEEHDPDNFSQVREAYHSILGFPDSLNDYARHLAQGGERAEAEIALPLTLLDDHSSGASAEPDKALWNALQNARLAIRAEAHINAMIKLSGTASWNQRARYMHEAFLRVAARHGSNSRGIVWAHNTHVGDARATEMVNRGQVNIGQLLSEQEGPEQVFIVGFSTSAGEVMAGRHQGNPGQVMTISPAHPDSVEGLLAEAAPDSALFLFDQRVRTEAFLHGLPHRAIGIVYDPAREAYVRSMLPWRYDALVHIRETRALKPLHN